MILLDAQQPARRSPLSGLHIDTPLLVGLLLLSGLGLIVLYSASGEDLDMVYAQTRSLLIALAIMVGIAQIPPTTLQRWTPWFYGLGVALLAAVLIFGDASKGAQR